MFSNKKGIYVIQTLLMIFVISGLLIFYMFQIFYAKNSIIDDKELQSQLIHKRILHGKCFSNDFGIIEVSKYTQDNFESCLSGINDKTRAKIELENKALDIHNFDEKSKFCSKNLKDTNFYCAKEVNYPIIYTENGENLVKVLKISTYID